VKVRESFHAGHVAVIFGIGVGHVFELVRRGRRIGRWFGRHWRVSRDELLAFCLFAGKSTRWSEVL
jgi:hypothetical protein